MPILDYTDAEVNPEIRRIQPTELCLEQKLGGERYRGNHNEGIYVGHLGSEKVIIKVFKSGWPDFNRVEINVLHDLQGITAVPTLFGYVEPGAITLQTAPDMPIPIEGAMVMVHAPGEPLMSVRAYTKPAQTKAYYAATGTNLHKEVAERIAAYHRGCLEREYIDGDVPERDILLFFDGRKVTVTKVDQGDTQNRRDIGLADKRIEIRGWKYNTVMKFLFSMVPKIHQESHLSKPTDVDDKEVIRFSSYYQHQGLSLLPALLQEFAEHKFDTDTFEAYRKFPDDITFLRFLGQWEKAMEEYGRWVIESPLSS